MNAARARIWYNAVDREWVGMLCFCGTLVRAQTKAQCIESMTSLAGAPLELSYLAQAGAS